MMHLVCLGFGYSARTFAASLDRSAWRISGTTRFPNAVDGISAADVTPIIFDGTTVSDELRAAIEDADQVLISIAPGDTDPVLDVLAEDLAAAPKLAWIGYLSTVGVYGDHEGEWVDETSPLRPMSQRSLRRKRAEEGWLAFGEQTGKPVMIFRLSGIYGPGRSPLDKVRNGKSRRIIKPGQVFNRIHVEDIAQALLASITKPYPNAIYNVTDDLPAPPQDVIEHAARLLNVDPPLPEAFDTADMTPIARSFYGENKRVDNARLKEELQVELKYPSYKEGLAAILETTGMSVTDTSDIGPKAD